MPVSPAPALFVGLGARIALDYFTRSGEASIKDFVLIGVWQGVGLHYASKVTTLAIAVGFAIAAKLLIEFNVANDITRTVTTLLGVALGILCSECLSQFCGSPPSDGTADSGRRKKKSSAALNGHSPRRERQVQFRGGEGDGSDSRHRAFRETVHAISDITSVDSHSEMIGPSASLTPLEVEVRTLRTRAALADSERRRFKEERKWAISQGNLARAAQMKSQVKHYTALMEGFNREADAKWLQASNGRSRRSNNEEAKPSSSKLPARPRHEQNGGQSNGQEPKSASKPLTRPRREPSGGLPNGQEPKIFSKQSGRPQRETSSGQPNGQTRHPAKQPPP